MDLLIAGQMTVICGGEKQLYEKCLPIMKCYCGTH